MYGFNLYADSIYLSWGTNASISTIGIFFFEVVDVFSLTRYFAMRSLNR